VSLHRVTARVSGEPERHSGARLPQIGSAAASHTGDEHAEKLGDDR
jgi:hypothetical protein